MHNENILGKNKYVNDPDNSRKIKDILFGNTALRKLIGKRLHAESNRFCEQEEIALCCSSK